MKLCVLGGSGGTGMHLIRQALAAGHDVTAIVRDPEAFTLRHPRLSIAVGDMLQPASLQCVAGHDAVISAAGPRTRGPTTLYSEGGTNVARAMQLAGMRRLVVVTGLGVDLAPDLPWHMDLVMKLIVRPLFGASYRDAAELERRLESIDVDWTSVRAPRLLDAPERGAVRSAAGERLHHPIEIGRADLATYLLSIVEDPRTFRRFTEVAW